MTDTTFNEINKLIRVHLEERDWHNQPSRSLVISVVLEATELLEHYQWDDKPRGSKEAIASEIADILIYVFQVAYNEKVDIPRAIREKLKVSAKKYPARDFKGKDLKKQQAAWLTHKLKHRKTGL